MSDYLATEHLYRVMCAGCQTRWKRDDLRECCGRLWCAACAVEHVRDGHIGGAE